MAAAPRQERLGRAELAGEWGGPSWTATQKYIFDLEMSKASAPRVLPFGVTMVAPVIMKYGSQAQKEQYLPDIRESKVWWCQGYSEPGSGSDLASLGTTAKRDGDHYIVNGTKTWTTLGQHADMIFCLVRTSKEEKRQDGISFLLIDMKSEGITVNPIVTIDNPRPGTGNQHDLLREREGPGGKFDWGRGQGLDLRQISP